MPSLVSFIIPAHDEAAHVAATIRAIRRAAQNVGVAYEVIVADDASADGTARIAADLGARVVVLDRRQIAAARNAGARASAGDVLFFVDADTLANPRAVRAGLKALSCPGVVGGGCVATLDGRLPLWGHALYPLSVLGARVLKLIGGCFLFCARDAFDRVGGFDERYFAGEEAVFLTALKRVGRVAIPAATVVTSGRKLRTLPMRKILGVAWKWAVGGPKQFQQREGLDIWYGPRAPEAPRRF
jgi:glycosyltransferase involved in cell wall biosynthesis